MVMDSRAAGSPFESFADVATSVAPLMYPSKTVSVTFDDGASISPFALYFTQRNVGVALESGVKGKDVIAGANAVGSAKFEIGELPAERRAMPVGNVCHFVSCFGTAGFAGSS